MKQSVITPSARILGVLAAVALTLLASGGPAAAHAELASSDPGKGSTVTSLPDQVELRFTEVVGGPASVSVTGPSGELAVGEPEVSDDVLTQRVDAEDLSPGRYTIGYQVTSADGHSIGGSVRFRVGSAGQEPIGSTGNAVSGGSTGGVGPDVSGGVLLALAGGLAAALALAVLSLGRVVGRVPRA